MSSQSQQTVLIGVTGCIAAYKSCELVRTLQKAGVRVKVVMTEHATSFVGPATFKALTREPVALKLFDEPGDPVHHISLAREADVFVIAPCTANVLNKLAHGVADDLLTTTALATTASLLIAPAMNVTMWRNPETQASIEALQARGVDIIQPTSGVLACGEEGEGKLASVEEIAERVLQQLKVNSCLRGKHLLITAGPTQEALDPVRYLGNRSSGKTGYALATAALKRGAKVTLVSGPTSLPNPFGVDTIRVTSACEMKEAVDKVASTSSFDAAIFTAAVADYRPAEISSQKIKKCHGGLKTIELVENPDILAEFGSAHGEDCFVVGFAAETQNPVEAAKAKLEHKNAHLIVANDVSNPTLGFSTDNNKVWFVSHDKVEEFGTESKISIANRLLDRISSCIS